MMAEDLEIHTDTSGHATITLPDAAEGFPFSIKHLGGSITVEVPGREVVVPMDESALLHPHTDGWAIHDGGDQGCRAVPEGTCGYCGQPLEVHHVNGSCREGA